MEYVLRRKNLFSGENITGNLFRADQKEVNRMNSLLKNFFGMNEKNRQEFDNLAHFREEFGDWEHPTEVSWEPHQIRPGESVSIKYQGLLRNAGAQSVILHYGFDSWNGVKEVPMEKTENNLFRANITAQGHSEINFCFKDNANNWDNNNGLNWSFPLH
jgi:hypothetical protein